MYGSAKAGCTPAIIVLFVVAILGGLGFLWLMHYVVNDL